MNRAPFAYWGSKVRMAPWIVERLPAHDHYIEACAGSAAVLARKPPSTAETLNDTYGEVVNFFRVLRDPVLSVELIDRVAFTPYSRAEFRAALDLLAVDGGSAVDRACAFLVSMQMAVVPGRTGWSYGSTGPSAAKANKPGRWSTMPTVLADAAARFAKVQVEQLDVCDLIHRYDKPGSLFFIDPPYTNESRPASTGSSSGYVDDAFDHVAMLEAIEASQHAIFVVVHYPDPLYDGARLVPVGDYESHRNSPNGSGRDVMVERLYVSPGGSPPSSPDDLFATVSS